jgi:sigma-B regulation protein RsbU (phosphoserine phosphatase)
MAAGSIQVSALIRAGRELAGHRPLNELFRFILDLSIEAVGAQRGVLMTLESERLIMRAARGESFRISSAVRDRVLNDKTSVLVRNVQQDDAFRARLSIVEQRVRTLMAVPLQTKDRIIGLIYLDSPGRI